MIHLKRQYAPVLIPVYSGAFFLICFVLLSIACDSIDRPGFTQLPGFTEYFTENPPSHDLPDPKDRRLFERYKPCFFLPPGNREPIGFYRDYIANGFLKNGSGRIISRSVTRELLNAFKEDHDAVFVHVNGKRANNKAVVYGRIVREKAVMDLERGRIEKVFTFLSYNMVFSNSGPPAGIPPWQELIMGTFFDLEDWHQLDHFTSATLVFEGDGHDGRGPVAVILQQHDNVRTYIVGQGIDFLEDDRIAVDIARRSNELYPHRKGRNIYRAVRIPDAEGLYYLITGKDKPLLAGHDITEGTRKVEYELDFLPPSDAFYTFKGFLGEQRLLPGRDGPHGADYNVIPEIRPVVMQLFFGYWRENDPGDIKRFNSTAAKGDFKGFALLQGAELLRDLNRLNKNGIN